jgi:Zn finger protein HypA/HybF involved in hydrogenase expression
MVVWDDYLARTFNLKTDLPMAAAVEAYCVKCKAKRNMKDPKENIMANGRKAMKGTCPECGTGMFKILGKA